jgi:hypothetical protein
VRTHSRGAAWLQGAMLVAACAAIALVLFMRLHRPFDRDTLAIQVSQLQSHAAEADLLARNVVADQLAPRFVRQHARQLADKVESVDGKLQSRPAQPGLQDVKASAGELGATLHAALQRLSRNGQQPLRQPFGFDALAARLDALHQQLKPAD